MVELRQGRILTLVGVIFISCSAVVGLDAESSTVPDGVVYTDVKKNLIIGNRGVLSCRFYGDPVAVYWVKGTVPENAPIQVVWHDGTKSGRRYDDGSYDMDDNYSLIIKDVQVTDTGRYICRVSNHRGILIHNFTDVALLYEGLETEPDISLEKGIAGSLPCKLNVRPKVVTWKKGPTYSSAKILVAIDNVGSRNGPGYEEGLFNITADYSLVIANVHIEDEGQYFCELLEVDTDTTFQEFSNVSVFARPIKPFPAIEGCSTTEDQSNCILTVDSAVKLTCHANEYYPDVGLYFKHGSKEVAALHTQTWNNTDGTKNKSLTIVGDISHELYRCIAFEIPGVDGNSSTSVRLIRRNGSPNLVALIVPLLLIAIGLLTWIFLRRRGMDRCISKGDRPTGHVTYVELWKLVEYARKHNEFSQLCDALLVLCNDGNESPWVTRNKENMYYYNGLCRWKETCMKRKQRTTLYDTFYKKGLEKSLDDLKDFRGTVSSEICKLDLEHILWEIGKQHKVTKFLESLKIDQPERQGEAETSLTPFHQQALDKLITWTRGKRDINPVITLSSTLEKLNHESANNFFRIPDEQKQGLTDSEYKEYARNFAKNHVTMLTAIIESSTNNRITVIKFILENWETLFNIEKMLHDWWEDLKCSNYKKRCTLVPLSEGQQKPPEDTTNIDEQWPSDDELKLIANYLDQKSTKHVGECLGISDLSESANKKRRFEALCAWRQSNKGEWTKMHDELISALKDTDISGLLSPLRNDAAVHKVEVVDIAFNLMMTDILPVARDLGVCDAQLSSYRPVFEPSHLTKGTIGLVATLVSLLDEKNQREELRRKLREGGFSSTIQKKMIAFKMSYGELSAIFNAVMRSGTGSEANTKTAQEGGQSNEGDSLLVTKKLISPGTTIVHMEPEVEEDQDSSQHFNIIKKMLNLTDEEVVAGSSMTETQDEFRLFKIWKEKLRLSAFNYRAAVIKCLQDFGKSEIARSVIEGKYKADEKSLSFIKHMVKKVIIDGRLNSLAKALNLQQDFPGAPRSDDAISETICESLMALKHAHGVCSQRVKEKDTRSLQVCQFDKLVDHGFLDLARELLIIDQQ